MDKKFLSTLYARELEAEYLASKHCLERIPESVYSYKPHPRSMEMGYLTQLVAEMPYWIAETLNKGVIDFATFSHFKLSTRDNLLLQFEEGFKNAIAALNNISDDQLEEPFTLQNKGQLLLSMSKKDSVSSTINHWVHHRGQLTVYMRLNEIPVPSIYGPSADDRNF